MMISTMVHCGWGGKKSHLATGSASALRWAMEMFKTWRASARRGMITILWNGNDNKGRQ
jgi:hypothetical protein